MPALELIKWTRRDEEIVEDDDHWARLGLLPSDLGWPANLTREKVLGWRRSMRRVAKEWALKPYYPIPPQRKTREELNQQLGYLEGFPEAQRAAIEAFEENERRAKRQDDKFNKRQVEIIPDAEPEGGVTAADFVEAAGLPHEKAMLHLDAMKDVAEQIAERLELFKKLDVELEGFGVDAPPVEGAPDVNSLLRDIEATITLLTETQAAIAAQNKGT